MPVEGSPDACSFCQKLAAEPPSPHPEDQPLMATDDFVVWASVGALVPGWLLVVPRMHVLSYGAMPTSLRTEFDAVAGHAKSLATGFGSSVYLFEHGPGREGRAVGCTVDHAHRHVAPLDFDLMLAIKRVAPALAWSRSQERMELQEIAAAGGDYVEVTTPLGDTWITRGPGIPSQLVRRAVTDELALGEYDWRREPRKQTVVDTVRRLQRDDAGSEA